MRTRKRFGIVLALLASIIFAALPGAATAAVSPVQSCADIRANNPSATDGTYTIYPAGRIMQVYCADMASTPKEYLSLVNTGGSFNVSNEAVGFAISGTSVFTHWDKIRIDPIALTVDPNDYRFSSSTGLINDWNWTQVPYTWAGACSASWGAWGKANVDLRGTPFAVAPGSFSWSGWPPYNPRTSVVYSNNDQVVDISGNGYCGSTSTPIVEYDPLTLGPLQLVFVGTADTTPPTVTYTGNAGNYTVDQAINITCTAADEPGGSGLAATTCQNVTGPAYSFATGANTYSATATDNAGNVGGGSTSFTVLATGASVENVITLLIPDAGTASSLKSQVQSVGRAPNAGAKAGKLQAFTNHVNALTGKKISPANAALLIRLAGAL